MQTVSVYSRFMTIFCVVCLFGAGTGSVSAMSKEEIFTSKVSADWNKDGIKDRAEVSISKSDGESLDFVIYLSGKDGKLHKSFELSKIGTTKGMAGTQPFVELNKAGSLVLGMQNSSIGRNRWEERIAIVFRDNRFIVAGYTYAAHDTLDLKNKKNCDINILSGKGLINGKQVRTVKNTVTLKAWLKLDRNGDLNPRNCTFKLKNGSYLVQ